LNDRKIIQKGDESGNGLIVKFRLPPGYKNRFPAKCWHCFMPESFFKDNCLKYHGVLQDLNIHRIGDGREKFGNDMSTLHLPGHSPDSLAVMLGNEAMVVGDVVLPEITPWPTCVEQYDEVAEVLGSLYPEAGAVFGLKRYIQSLKELLQIAERYPNILVLPAHRLYYQEHWNIIQLKEVKKHCYVATGSENFEKSIR